MDGMCVRGGEEVLRFYGRRAGGGDSGGTACVVNQNTVAKASEKFAFGRL